MYAKTTATRKIANLENKIRAVQGGTSASKTISILIYLIVMAQSDKTKTLTSVVAESIPHLKRGAIRDFKNIMTEHGYWKDSLWNATDSIYTFETGSQIEFFSADQPDKLRGARRERLFINECNNVPLDAFDQLEVRTKDFVYLDWNPTNEFWFYTDILDNREDVDHIILTYQDNEALSEEIVHSIEQRKNRPGWWKVYGMGLLGEVEGRIYKGWQQIDEVPHEARLERYGLDFGWSPDPVAVVAIYYYNGGYIIDEVLYQNEMSNRELAETLKNLPKAIVVADNAEPKSIAELKMYGLNVIPTKKGRDSIKYGCMSVQDQKISVTRSSTHLWKEYTNYLWDEDKDGKVIPGKPKDGNDHLMDALRYGMNSVIPVLRKKEIVANYPFPMLKGKKKGNPAR
jgi:phage terminase large subunit